MFGQVLEGIRKAPALNVQSEARAIRDRQLAALSKYLDTYMRSPPFLTSLRSGLMIMVSIRLLYRLHASAPSRAAGGRTSR